VTGRAMDNELVGYLLDGLDERAKRDVEAQLQTSPEARQQLAQLRQVLEPLAADKEPAPPPAGLVVRTLTRVAEHICSEERELPRAPTLKFEAPAASRRWWHRADAVIAACLLLTALGVLLPAMLRLRSSSTVVACQNNLRQFWVALQTYRDQHHSYPDLESLPEPRDVAGMVVPILADAGALPADASIRCPGNGGPLACQVTLADLRMMSLEQFRTQAPLLSGSYAYSLGYRDEGGTYHSPGRNPQRPELVPLMADRIADDADGTANSGNHGGAGQNVLYLDGSVRWLVSRVIVDDDLYLNRQNLVAAGLG